MRGRAVAVRQSTTMKTSSAGKSRQAVVPRRSPVEPSRCRPTASQSQIEVDADTIAASMHARTSRDRGRISGWRSVATMNTTMASTYRRSPGPVVDGDSESRNVANQTTAPSA